MMAASNDTVVGTIASKCVVIGTIPIKRIAIETMIISSHKVVETMASNRHTAAE
jgi:hypothetical protein